MHVHLNVLLVEDEKQDAALIIRHIEKAGYTVHFKIVDTAEKLQNMLLQQKWDIILSDYSLPAFGGPEALELVKANNVDVPFILISGTIGEETAVKIMRDGASDYLMKGNLVRLGTVIKNELAAAKARRERLLLDHALNQISTAISKTGIDDFLQKILLQLTDSLAADYGLIGLFSRSSVLSEIETACFCANGKIIENIRYNLEGTPCENILNNSVCVYEDEVAALFPTDVLLAQEAIRGYIGIPLVNSGGHTIGIMSLMYKQAVQSAGVKKSILKIYSSRVVSEIERSQSQQALKESEQRFAAIFKNSPVGVSLVSLHDGIFQDVNDILLKRTGYTREEIIGKTTEELNFYKNPADRQFIFDSIKQYGFVENKECEFTGKYGQDFFCLVSLSVVHIGGIAYLISSIMDIHERKIAQDKLTESEAKVSAYFNSTTEAIVMIDPLQKILGFNKVYENYIQQVFSTPVNIGDELMNYIQPEDRLDCRANITAALQGGRAYVETRIQYAGEEKRWTAISFVAVKNTAGAIIGVAINHTDIDERKKAEQELAASENKLSAYFNSTTDVIILIAPDYNIMAFNKVCESMIWKDFGKQIKAGDNMLEYLNIVLVDGFKTNFCTALSGRQVALEKEVSYQDKKTWCSVNYNPVYNKAGNIIGVAFNSADITKLKMGEKILKDSEVKFRSMVHNISDIITLISINGNILYESASIKQVLGFEEDELIGRNIFELLHPDDIAFIATELEKVATADGSSMLIDFRFLNKEGKYVLLEAQASNQLKNPAINAIVVNSRDITQRKNVEAALMKQAHDLAVSNIELERFAYVASHDLQEPLRMVNSFMTLLQKKYENQLDATANKYISYAVEGSNRMKQLINDLLLYSRVGSKARPPEYVNMQDATNEVLAILQHEIELSGATVNAAALPVVSAIKIEMIQLLQNLVGNALKYQPPGNKAVINIACTDAKKEWLFSVADNGIGIDPAFKEKIFVVFQRLHNKDAFSGTGIGLSICKKIIERLGGKIWLESELNKGCTFYFTIPK